VPYRRSLPLLFRLLGIKGVESRVMCPYMVMIGLNLFRLLGKRSILPSQSICFLPSSHQVELFGPAFGLSDFEFVVNLAEDRDEEV